jgi:hypothetical protein
LKRQFRDDILERNSFVHKSYISRYLLALTKDSLNMCKINNNHNIEIVKTNALRVFIRIFK